MTPSWGLLFFEYSLVSQILDISIWVSYFLDISSVEGRLDRGIKKPCGLRKQGSHGSNDLLHCRQSDQERGNLII